MPVVNIEPSSEHPVPYDTSDETSNSYLDEIAVAANTAELQVELGAPLEVDEKTANQEKELIERAIREKKTQALTNTTTAFAAAAFLRTYGQQLAMDVSQARAAITHKLMELANCGDPRYELKALELLGKHSDIGLFTERSEVTINYKDPSDLENAIKERVKRLLNADVVDVTPLGADLDDQLGVAKVPEYRTDLMDELDGKSEEPVETEEPEEIALDDDNQTTPE
jgi:hypothetical protein